MRLPPGGGPCGRRGRATRARILQRATHAFASAGYDATSLTGDILTPAGISVGSFYHQFDDKLELLLTVLREHAATRRRASLAPSADDLHGTDLAERLLAVLSRMLDEIDREADVCTVELRERWNADPRVRAAVGESWAPWREALVVAIDGADQAVAAAPAAELVGRSLLGTLGTYLATPTEDRDAWRASELPALVRFCSAGIGSLGRTA